MNLLADLTAKSSFGNVAFLMSYWQMAFAGGSAKKGLCCKERSLVYFANVVVFAAVGTPEVVGAAAVDQTIPQDCWKKWQEADLRVVVLVDLKHDRHCEVLVASVELVVIADSGEGQNW